MIVVCVPGVTCSSTCAGMFSLTITKTLGKLSWNCCFFQVWNKAIKSYAEIWKLRQRLAVAKAFEGNKRHRRSVKGQGFLTMAKGLLEICVEFSQVIYWLTTSHKPWRRLKAQLDVKNWISFSVFCQFYSCYLTANRASLPCWLKLFEERTHCNYIKRFIKPLLLQSI